MLSYLGHQECGIQKRNAPSDMLREHGHLRYCGKLYLLGPLVRFLRTHTLTINAPSGILREHGHLVNVLVEVPNRAVQRMHQERAHLLTAQYKQHVRKIFQYRIAVRDYHT